MKKALLTVALFAAGGLARAAMPTTGPTDAELPALLKAISSGDDAASAKAEVMLVHLPPDRFPAIEAAKGQ